MKFLIVLKNIGKCVVDTEGMSILYPDGNRKALQQWDLSELQQRHKHQSLRGLV